MGSTGIKVKQKVKPKSLLGGGLGEPKFMVWGPLRWPQITTKVMVVTVVSAAQGSMLTLQLTLKVSGAHRSDHYILLIFYS